MNKLINFVNGTLLPSEQERILEGNPDKQDYHLALCNYRSMGSAERQIYLHKLFDRLCGTSKAHQAISVLILVHKLGQIDAKVSTPNLSTLILEESQTQQKVALANLLNFFHYFVHSALENRLSILRAEPNLNQKLAYCENAIERFIRFLKIDFVVCFCLQKVVKRRAVVKKSLQIVLQELRKDMVYIIAVAENSLDLILKGHSECLRINFVYEKLLFINKHVIKVRKIARLVGFQEPFPEYNVEIKTNREIEFAMSSRLQEKDLYLKSRRVKSLRCIEDEQDEREERDGLQDCFELDEEDIILRDFLSEDDSLMG